MKLFNIFKKNDKQLTLEEKWNIDIEFYKNHPDYKVKTSECQCYRCVYKNVNNGLHCDKIGKISKDILFDEVNCKYRLTDKQVYNSK